VIAAGGSEHTRCGRLSRQHVAERAARLEGARVLHEFALESEPNAGQCKLGAIGPQHRRATHVRRDARGSGADLRRRQLLFENTHGSSRSNSRNVGHHYTGRARINASSTLTNV
jgi:hypothetical protein